MTIKQLFGGMLFALVAGVNGQEVHVLTDSNIDEFLKTHEDGALVEFYAPWCGHCKQLAPVYDEVGEAFSEEDGVVIAKMDSTANEIDIPGVSVKGFPTIVFFKGNDKANPVVYEGGRTKADFIKYMKKNASNSLGDVDEDEDDEDDEEDEEDEENDEL